jgi:cell division protein ZapA
MGATKENAQSTRVVIFGTEYAIKSDVDVETTRKVARYVNSKMAEITDNISSRDNTKIAVLSALNIAGELFELKDKKANGAREITDVRDRVAAITKKIDAALKQGC